MNQDQELYDSADLRDDVEEGARFYVETYIPADTDVTVADAGTGRVPSHIDHSDDAWAFAGQETGGSRWYFLVDPERGGPNGGVVYCFWIIGDGGLGGHHEVYPRAFHFLDDD